MTDELTDTDQASADENRRQVAWRSKCDRVNWVMKGTHGRHLLWELMEQLGPFRSAFDSSSDRMTAYLSGRKDFGLQLFQELNLICPEYVQLMTREAHERAAARTRT